jgi:hypothetical protein
VRKYLTQIVSTKFSHFAIVRFRLCLDQKKKKIQTMSRDAGNEVRYSTICNFFFKITYLISVL